MVAPDDVPGTELMKLDAIGYREKKKTSAKERKRDGESSSDVGSYIRMAKKGRDEVAKL
jgi:hypothetical protein